MFDVVLGGVEFDPLDDDDDEPIETRSWLVQFHAPLSGQDVVDLRDSFGLRLTEYVPNLTYLERIERSLALAVRADPRVRAVVPYRPEFKVAPAVKLRRDDDPDAEKQLVDAVLFDDADVTRVAARLRQFGVVDLTVLDDRARRGWPMVRFRVKESSTILALAELDDVRWITPVMETVDDATDQTAPSIVGTAAVAALWSAGLHGEGQIIGIIDNGLPDLRHRFFADPATALPGPGHRKVLQVRDETQSDLVRHATFVAGCAAGDDWQSSGGHLHRGGAWAARIVAGNRRDLAGTTLLAELQAAAAAGARIHNNSWHSASPDGPGRPASYDQRAAEADAFTWSDEEQLVVASSGNNNEDQGAPGTAKNSLCVSAASSLAPEDPLGDGARGPTADGRRKPDVTAVGCGILSALVGTESQLVERPCASSWATPHAAAAAALARQYFCEGFHPSGRRVPADAFTPSGALLKSVLVNAARGAARHPTDVEGWGVVDIGRALPLGDERHRLVIRDVRNGHGLMTGESHRVAVQVRGDTEPLKVTLVWTEPPGTPAARPVINDLDLRATTPSGVTFLGNVFRDGASVVGGEADRRNNVEVVLVPRPELGPWTLTVHAAAVNVERQGYALVASGDLAEADPSPGEEAVGR